MVDFPGQKTFQAASRFIFASESRHSASAPSLSGDGDPPDRRRLQSVGPVREVAAVDLVNSKVFDLAESEARERRRELAGNEKGLPRLALSVEVREHGAVVHPERP